MEVESFRICSGVMARVITSMSPLSSAAPMASASSKEATSTFSLFTLRLPLYSGFLVNTALVMTSPSTSAFIVYGPEPSSSKPSRSLSFA